MIVIKHLKVRELMKEGHLPNLRVNFIVVVPEAISLEDRHGEPVFILQKTMKMKPRPLQPKAKQAMAWVRSNNKPYKVVHYQDCIELWFARKEDAALFKLFWM